jgi:hypothetical protein
LEDPAGGISDFTYVLAHVCIDGPEGGTSLAKFSIPFVGDTGRREKVFRINTGVTRGGGGLAGEFKGTIDERR